MNGADVLSALKSDLVAKCSVLAEFEVPCQQLSSYCGSIFFLSFWFLPKTANTICNHHNTTPKDFSQRSTVKTTSSLCQFDKDIETKYICWLNFWGFEDQGFTIHTVFLFHHGVDTTAREWHLLWSVQHHEMVCMLQVRPLQQANCCFSLL